MLFYREHVVDVLLLLEQFYHDAFATKRCLTEISRLLRATPPASLAVLATDYHFVPRLHACLQPHAANMDIVHSLCLVLQHLLRLPDATDGSTSSALHHDHVVESGLWKIVLDAMKRDLDNVAFHIIGFALLSSLCYAAPFTPHETNQRDLVHAGAMDMVLHITTLHSEMTAVGASTLADLCYKNRTSLAMCVCHDLAEATNADRAFKAEAFQLFSKGLHRAFRDAASVSSIAAAIFHLHVASPAKAQQCFLQWSLLDRWVTCVSAHVDALDVQYQLLRTLDLLLRHNETAKDAFCAKEMPFHLVTALDAMHDTFGVALAPVAYVAAIVFASVAVTTTSAGAWFVHGGRIQNLIKASVHSFAVSSLTHFPKAIPALEQCIRLVELLAMPGTYRAILIRAGAARHIRYIYTSKKHDGVIVLCERALGALESGS
ncbi:Aste57867_5630 [Aphanomyces stellatus]|uniref:Aste57867_5630 protein n=1 Tax=Aphanomyces stellatus TaxID=120398 RepID=A0A485KHH3_9STRA|nr:hypothetical protein As57867_005617 [Aphanomyces stellatus]VFT82676.1 Aste57867_5630 [Aphanomyces stellatus]